MDYMKLQKHSGQLWSVLLRVHIVEPTGWDSINDFNHVLITKEEFCNRAANSVLKTVGASTRRDAARVLKKI